MTEKPYLVLKKSVDCRTSDFYDHVLRRQFQSLALGSFDAAKLFVLVDNAQLHKDNGIYTAKKISQGVYGLTRTKDLKDNTIHLVRSEFQNTDNTYARVESLDVGNDPVKVEDIHLNDRDEDHCRSLIVQSVMKKKK